MQLRRTLSTPLRVGFVSSFPPRRCGIASFTADLAGAIRQANPAVRIAVVAVDPGWERWERQAPYPAGVDEVFAIEAEQREQYWQAAQWLARWGCQVVSVQHEYGLFGGVRGSYILDLVEALRVPVVSTLHTVLRFPDPPQRDVLARLAARSRWVVAQARSAVELLVRVYGVDPGRMVVIPHGTPVFAPRSRERARAALEVEPDRPVLLTYGLIGPGKGIEQALAAVREVARRHPRVLYLVAGQTHPNVRRSMGEAYREHLQNLVLDLGLQDHVRFIDRYLDLEELGLLLAAADVYVTPYPNLEQVVSGTLSYALAAGKAVVSTPFRYAREVLGPGRGLLCQAGDPSSMAREILRVLDSPELRRSLEHRAWSFGQSLRWELVGVRYMRLLQWVAQEAASDSPARRWAGVALAGTAASWSAGT